MEIKVNDYVRTKQGYIGKAIIIAEYNTNIEDKKIVRTKDIIKSSPRIIDLIEVGDYVNGQLVKHTAYFEGVEEPIKKLIFADEYHLIPTEVCEENEIKSIVTKEQFEQMEYKID